jgi:hypothetical protein
VSLVDLLDKAISIVVNLDRLGTYLLSRDPCASAGAYNGLEKQVDYNGMGG